MPMISCQVLNCATCFNPISLLPTPSPNPGKPTPLTSLSLSLRYPLQFLLQLWHSESNFLIPIFLPFSFSHIKSKNHPDFVFHINISSVKVSYYFGALTYFCTLHKMRMMNMGGGPMSSWENKICKEKRNKSDRTHFIHKSNVFLTSFFFHEI